MTSGPAASAFLRNTRPLQTNAGAPAGAGRDAARPGYPPHPGLAFVVGTLPEMG
jgi:hypothetical protein